MKIQTWQENKTTMLNALLGFQKTIFLMMMNIDHVDYDTNINGKIEINRKINKIKGILDILCTYQCKSHGGGQGSAGKGGELTAKIHLLSGRFDQLSLLGVGTFELFSRETGAKIKCGYLASSFMALE